MTILVRVGLSPTPTKIANATSRNGHFYYQTQKLLEKQKTTSRDDAFLSQTVNVTLKTNSFDLKNTLRLSSVQLSAIATFHRTLEVGRKTWKICDRINNGEKLSSKIKLIGP